MNFSVFSKIVFLTSALLTLGRNTIQYYAVLTSPTKLNLKGFSSIWSTFCRKTRLVPDHRTNICFTFIWSITRAAIPVSDTIMPEKWSFCSFSFGFDVCQRIQRLQAPLFWQAAPPSRLVLYPVTPRTAIIWAGVRLIFFLFMMVLWSCRVEITADLCLDATPGELACSSMSPMKRYI